VQVTILTDNKPIGKTLAGTKHPISGVMNNKQFHNVQDFSAIISDLTINQCLMIGLFQDKYNYTSSADTKNLSKPRYITRTAANASPGHIFLIDCDYEQFYSLKGQPLHDFLAKYLPDIFDGAAYFATNSTSFYTKGKKAFHQYYLFEHPTDTKQLNTLVDKLFKHHNMLQYSLASNYSRVFIKTPIDTKLHELQMPVFEASQQRLLNIGNEDNPSNLIGEGHSVQASSLALPTIDTSEALTNEHRVKEDGETDRQIKMQEFATTHNVPSRTKELERQQLPASMTLVTDKTTETTIVSEVQRYMLTQEVPHSLYMAVGEPAYASHQTAKLFYENPLDLNSYRLVDQAHGGTTYTVVFDYQEMDEILSHASRLSKREVATLIGAHNTLDVKDAMLLTEEYHKLIGFPKAQLKSLFIMSNVEHLVTPLEPDSTDISTEDEHTAVAALAQGRVALSKTEQMMLDKGVDTNKLFKNDNINILEDGIRGYGKDDVIMKPGPSNELIMTSRPKAVKLLAPLYPPTNLSPHADEVVMSALIQKFSASNKVEAIAYKSSLHGEKLFFGDGKVDITYQQPRPTFENVSTPIKQTLDTMSGNAYSEFRDMYMNESLGDIWGPIAELSYIKKVYPQLKTDFLWVHLESDAGKTFNMDIANVIAGYEKTNLDQLLQQAAKLSPTSIAKSAFLFHDEVKSFHHQWNELGAFHPIMGMYATTSILTQLPLKILASKEAVLAKGTKQQLNRLMVYNSGAKDFKLLGIKPEHLSMFSAVTHQVIYEAFTASYNKYAGVSEQKALQTAIVASKGLAAKLAPKDMMVTEDYLKELIADYLMQELFTDHEFKHGELPVLGELERYIKTSVIKEGIVYVNFKKMDAPAFIEHVLRQTTSSIETRSMNYEALGMTWETLGCYKSTKTKTIAGKTSFYGQVLEIDTKDYLEN